MIMLRYFRFDELEPRGKAKCWAWLRDGSCHAAIWDRTHWDIYGVDFPEVVYWAYVPLLEALEANYGKEV